MPGVTGMRHAKGRHKAIRNQIWQSLRILRRFTLPDVCRTIPEGAKYANVRKFVSNLHRHGYVAKAAGYTSGRAGSYQVYTLVKDVGPNYPTTCARCGGNLNLQHCEFEEKEKETKKETIRETETATPHTAKGATP